MKIGYASLTYGVHGMDFKTTTAKYAIPERLRELIAHNLFSLKKTVEYNQTNGINMFRISSGLIPFGSSPVNHIVWWEEFREQLDEVGKAISDADLRVSMHPGQYTVINSPDQGVVERSREDLIYHARLLDSLGCGSESKIILHVGGVYGEKETAMARFAEEYQRLPLNVKNRLVIENDDVSYTIQDVLELSGKIGAPVVYDNLHNRLNPYDPSRTDAHWIKLSGETWTQEDGTQKIHYSQQSAVRRAGGHSQTIELEEFSLFYQSLPYDLDIMLEVKDKNLSALKALHLIQPERGIQGLEKEWARYKYLVLEHSPSVYQEIRTLLKDKESYPVFAFYRLIDEALNEEKSQGKTLNALDHIWGYFKETATEAERSKFSSYRARFVKGTIKAHSVKRVLLKLAEKHHQQYLLHSYFFYL